MRLKSLFPVIASSALTEARDFYLRYFGFEVVFETEWYVQLHGPRDGGDAPLELAFALPGHESLPPGLREAFDGKGVFLTFEVDEVDALHEQMRRDGCEILIELRDEAWGQRHFGVRDPSGSLLDVVKPIPPAAEYRGAYQGGSGT
ncbi:MAG: VOC family protein [Steroidobacteraceae bacterium]